MTTPFTPGQTVRLTRDCHSRGDRRRAFTAGTTFAFVRDIQELPASVSKGGYASSATVAVSAMVGVQTLTADRSRLMFPADAIETAGEA